jgi:hypothetical protein
MYDVSDADPAHDPVVELDHEVVCLDRVEASRGRKGCELLERLAP